MKQQLQSFIRSGGYAWPGGYQCHLVMDDGEVLCVKCAHENYRLIRQAEKAYRDSWKPLGVEVYWEGPAEQCAHCGADIPSAYGDPSEDAA